MRGIKIATDKFMRGACQEGKQAVYSAGGVEEAWKGCDRIDWSLWLLRRKHAGKRDDMSKIIRLFYDFADEARELIPKGKKRNKFFKESADSMREIFPELFNN